MKDRLATIGNRKILAIANGNKGVRGRMAGKEYTIRGAHVRGSTGVQYPWMLILESHLVQRGDKAGLVPHGSRLGDLERREGRRRLHQREDCVSLRRCAENPRTPALLDRRKALGRPGVVAELWTHGASLLGSTSSATT